jgi:hypothetical protein
MSLFSRRFVLLSPLRPDEALAKLGAAIGPRGKPGSAYYKGDVTAAGFSIIRNVKGGDSFHPTVTGRVEPGGAGCRAEMTVSIQTGGKIYMAGWFFVTLFGFFDALHHYLEGLKQYAGTSPAFLLVLAFIALMGFSIPYLTFRSECRNAESFLAETFRAQIERPMDSRHSV